MIYWSSSSEQVKNSRSDGYGPVKLMRTGIGLPREHVGELEAKKHGTFDDS
jgi:hypothetical protein